MRNEMTISGTVNQCEYLFSREDKVYYKTIVDVKRTSGKVDSLCVLTRQPFEVGDGIYAEGELRSFDDKYSATNKLKTYISPKIVRESHENEMDINLYHCEGIIVKQPIFCETATGRRLSRFIIAVNSERANYIPCVVWGSDATIDRNVGDSVSLCGRYQSRTYYKNGTERTAYEVSVQTIGF